MFPPLLRELCKIAISLFFPLDFTKNFEERSVTRGHERCSWDREGNQLFTTFLMGFETDEPFEISPHVCMIFTVPG